jgi:multidrug efflux pump subunit AcrA (membrane-fusion protein)
MSARAVARAVPPEEQSMRGVRPVALLAITLALGCMAVVGPAVVLGEPPAGSPVVLAEVVEQEIKQGRAFVGTVEAVRSGSVDAQAAGYVEVLDVEAGQRVEAHHVLAKLRTKTLDLRLEAARAELRLREAAKAELDSGSRPGEKAQAAARVIEARARERAAAWKLAAARKLRETAQFSEQELRDAEEALQAARARLAELEAARALVEEGPRREQIAQATAHVEVQAAEVARLEDERERHTITAPYGGYVVAKRTEVGAWLAVGAPVIDLVALDEVDVVVPVLEDAIVHLERGATVNVVIDALPRPYVTGTIRRIVPVADRRSRTVPVRVRVENVAKGGEMLIKPGMFARVHLAVGEPRRALLVPKDAVVLGGPGPVVYVHDPEAATATPVPVRLGVAVEDLIEVSGDLAAGAKVVVRGNERIFPGTRVRPVEVK